MRAMIFTGNSKVLELQEIPKPQPKKGQILVKVHDCGLCRTDLHIIDKELSSPKLPLVLGHQIIGTVEEAENSDLIGKLVGIPWLSKTCQKCAYCLSGKENLCDKAIYTGYHIDGGFAEYCVAHPDYVFVIPAGFSPSQAAPLLCAGLIGYRSLRFTENAKTIGFFGFGAAAHLLIQVVNYRGGKVYAFTRKGDTAKQQSALACGAAWSGDSDQHPDILLDAAIIFASVGELVPKALRIVKKGGLVVCAGIHMSDIPSFPYSILWQERQVRSVANLTRQDGKEFLQLAATIPLETETKIYPLEELNQAVADFRNGNIGGTAVIKI